MQTYGCPLLYGAFLATAWWSKSENVTISQLIRALGRAVHDLQHSRSGLMSDKSRTALRARINYNEKNACPEMHGHGASHVQKCALSL